LLPPWGQQREEFSSLFVMAGRKAQSGGTGDWSRFNQNAQPISPEEAHPNPLPENPIPPIFRFGGAIGVFLGTLLYSGPAE
jgi:hypothetical protein